MPTRRVSDADLERVLEEYEEILDSPQSGYTSDSGSHYAPSPGMPSSVSMAMTPSPVSVESNSTDAPSVEYSPPGEYYETYQDLTGVSGKFKSNFMIF